MADHRMQQLFSRLNPNQQQPPVPLMSNLMFEPQPPPSHPQQAQMTNNFRSKHLQEEQQTLLRLQYDFEFVQHLCSPDYVKWLMGQGYFDQAEFINYLQYLTYWRQPQYLQLLVQPKCLDVLEMLLNSAVREEIRRKPDFCNYFSN